MTNKQIQILVVGIVAGVVLTFAYSGLSVVVETQVGKEPIIEATHWSLENDSSLA